jgi:hypothetical protein
MIKITKKPSSKPSSRPELTANELESQEIARRVIRNYAGCGDGQKMTEEEWRSYAGPVVKRENQNEELIRLSVQRHEDRKKEIKAKYDQITREDIELIFKVSIEKTDGSVAYNAIDFNDMNNVLRKRYDLEYSYGEMARKIEELGFYIRERKYSYESDFYCVSFEKDSLTAVMRCRDPWKESYKEAYEKSIATDNCDKLPKDTSINSELVQLLIPLGLVALVLGGLFYFAIFG